MGQAVKTMLKTHTKHDTDGALRQFHILTCGQCQELQID